MSFCRITGRARSLPKPNFFPIIPPISPAGKLFLISSSSSDPFCSLYRIIHYIKCNMLSKSSKWELGLVHYIAEFTISRFVMSRFKCTYVHTYICIHHTDGMLFTGLWRSESVQKKSVKWRRRRPLSVYSRKA